MSGRKNKGQKSSRLKSEGANVLQRLRSAAPLHVYAPGECVVRPERVASEAPALSVNGGDVVDGFAGQVAAVARDRCTLYLSRELNTQLDLVAHIERKDRSAIVESLLREHLPKYRVERA